MQENSPQCNASSADAVICLSGVSRFFGERLIFRDVSLDLRPGCLALLLGANGAGKSSLLRIMAGLAKPDSGRVTVRENARVAYMGHQTFLYPALTALENLEFWAKANDLPAGSGEALKALKRVGLHAHAHDQTRVFSRGMAQRLNFARVLMQEPDAFLLDEPFAGLDTVSRESMRTELNNCRNKGSAILVVTHSPRDEGRLADRIFTLKNRKLETVDVAPDAMPDIPPEYLNSSERNTPC